MKTVLVTGASGFIGLHCIDQLLSQGYDVRGTVRSLGRKDELEKALANKGHDLSKFKLFEADLSRADGWDEAVAGCHYILHIASPFIIGVPKHEDELIKPAVSGVDYVVNAAIKHNVSRVVLTSSGAAITDTHDGKTHFTEEDWTDTDHPKTTAYYKSKTLAERHAWDLINAQKGKSKTELSVINPTVVLGPTLTNDIGTSNDFIKQILIGKVPAAANLHFGFVDVRDVAAIHINAMTHKKAAGQRFIANAKEMWLIELTTILNKAGHKKAPLRKMPNWLVKVFGLFDAPTKQISQLLDSERFTPSTKAENTLGWQARDIEGTIIETAEQIASLSQAK
ncbi:MAG: aldehyde reductase [Alphaproteobacteria bacterium]|nr:aldehyde reductase [Alphaproteobacteria bacterium]